MSNPPVGHQPRHPFDTLAKANRALNPWGFVLYRYSYLSEGRTYRYFRIIAGGSIEHDAARVAICEDWQASHEYFGQVGQYDHLSPDTWQSGIRDFLIFALSDPRLEN